MRKIVDAGSLASAWAMPMMYWWCESVVYASRVVGIATSSNVMAIEAEEARMMLW